MSVADKEVEAAYTLIEAQETKVITPEVVYAFAYCFMQDDNGNPIEPAPHHKLWVELLCDTRIKQLLMIAPPESAKTTWTVLSYVGAYVSIFPQRNVILGSSSGATAETRSTGVRNIIEQDVWRDIFPHITRAEGLKYTPTQWSIAENGKPYPGRIHPTLSAYGLGGSITGARGDLLIGDDLLNEENTKTQYLRDVATLWLYRSFLSRRKSKTGRAIIIGTPWHSGDMYSELRRKPEWFVCHTPLLHESEEVSAHIRYPADWEYEIIGEPYE